jgi:thiol-disulfide isomerase/thioredoxin
MKPSSPKRSHRIVIAAVAITVLALGAGIVKNWPKDDANIAQQTQSELISQPRPEFTMPDLTGTHRAVKEWDGKVLAVNFWATWCEPCKQEIIDFNVLQKKYGTKGLQFIGVALDDQESVKTYLKTSTIEYPVLIGGDEAVTVATHYGDDAGVVPYTAFIDRKGRIAFLQYGEMSRDLAQQIIESLL